MARSKNPFQTSEAVDNIGVESAVATLPEPPTEQSEVHVPKVKAAPATTTVPVEFMTQLLAMFAEKMNEGLSKVLIAARTAPVDPIKEKQRERAEKTKTETEAAYWANLRHRALSCPGNHRRSNMTSAVAWATQSDQVTRGICQHCFTVFSPRLQECCCPEVHEQYKELIRVPTNTTDSVNYIT